MAVLEAVPGLEVYVKIDDIALREYDDDKDEQTADNNADHYKRSRTVTKYVESVTDKIFTVEITLMPGFIMTSDLQCKIHIDGKRARTALISKEYEPAFVTGDKVHTKMTCVIDGVRTPAPSHTDQFLLQRFKFSEIETCKKDQKLRDIKEDIKRIDKLGEIVVEIHRTETGRQVAYKARPSVKMESEKIHEKALEGHALKSLLIIGQTPSPKLKETSASYLPDAKKPVPKQKKKTARGQQGIDKTGPSVKRKLNSKGSDNKPRKKVDSGPKVTKDPAKEFDNKDTQSLN